jgi:hypothetical protein
VLSKIKDKLTEAIPWLYPPEILPLSIRAKGASLSTACCWVDPLTFLDRANFQFFNFIVGETTPILQETIGYRLYLMHASWCAVSLVIVYFFYPETKGVGLEEMDLLFGDMSLAPTPRAQSLYSEQDAAAPPDEAQVAEYLKQQAKATDLTGLLDKLRGVPNGREEDGETASIASSTRPAATIGESAPLINHRR